MRFDVRQHFRADATEVMRHYASAELYESLPEFGRISRPNVLDRRESGDRITLRLRYRFTAELPAAALAVIDPDKLSWVDETVYDLSSLTSTTALQPDHYPRKLEASARASFHDTADGSRRDVSGDLRVHVLLVGGQVEKAIVSGLAEHLAEEAEHVTRLLAEP